MKENTPFSQINTATISKALDTFAEKRILVIGDIMVDEYLWGTVSRISPEAPIQIVDVQRQEYRLGGSGNVVNNLRSLDSQVSVVSVIGDGFHRQFVIDEFSRLGVSSECLIFDEVRTATKKTRVIAASQQVVRIDFETRKPISTKCQNLIKDYLTQNTSQFDAIILSDYAKGVLTSPVVSCAIENGRKNSIPVVVDPKGNDFGKYFGATVITPNTREAQAVSNTVIQNDSDAARAARKILTKTNSQAVIITRGRYGMTLLEASKKKAVHVPTRAQDVFDVSGAGDTVVAVLALGISADLSYNETVLLANTAGGIVVGKLGISIVSREELSAALSSEQDLPKEKSLSQLESIISALQQEKKRLVFVYGSFDPVGAKDIEILKKGKQLGDILLVGIDSDRTICRLKAPSWSPLPQQTRIRMLSALDWIDYLVVLEDEMAGEVIQRLQPDIVLQQGEDQPFVAADDASAEPAKRAVLAQS